MKTDHISWCLSVANKVSMLLGDVNTQNVREMLTNPKYQTMHPAGISTDRCVAMVVSWYRNNAEVALTMTPPTV